MVKEGGRLVVYVVRTADVSNQFAALWHNIKMQKLVGIDRRCLFARVAWAVLSLHHEFLSIRRLASDNLLVRMKGGELKEMAPEMFKQFSRSRSRNPSPTKRPRLQALEEDAGVIIAAELGWGNETGDEAGNDLEDKEQQHYGADDGTVLTMVRARINVAANAYGALHHCRRRGTLARVRSSSLTISACR